MGVVRDRLILSKLVLVVMFLVAITQCPTDRRRPGLDRDPIAGIVLMFVAAFAPYMVYKFISFVGFDMYHAMMPSKRPSDQLARAVPVRSSGRTARRKCSTERPRRRATARQQWWGGGTPPPDGGSGRMAAGTGGAGGVRGAGAAGGAGWW
jgi:hypothetical protein